MTQKNFYDFFPPPRFLTLPAIGLFISDDAVRFVEYGQGLKGLELKRYGEKILPPSVVRSGHVENQEVLVDILKEMKKQYGFNFVYAALPEEKAYLFQTEIPIVSPKEIQETIEFKIEENVPLSLSEVVFDYHVTKGSGGRILDVVVCVLPIKVSSVYADILKAAQLTPLSLEIESQAIVRATIKKGDQRAILIINLSRLKTGFYIASEEIIHFSSTINRGTQSLFGGVSVATKPTIDKQEGQGEEIKGFQNKGNVISGDKTAISTAENVQHTEAPSPKNLKNTKEISDANDIQKEKLSTVFEPEAAEIFKDTAKKFISYWQTYRGNVEGKTIQKIIICGEGSSSEEFANYLGNQTGIPTEIANVWTNAFSFDEYIPPLDFKESVNYVAAAGLALTPYK